MKQLSAEEFLMLSVWWEIKQKCKNQAAILGHRECAKQLGISVGTFERIINDKPIRPTTIKKCINAYANYLDKKER